MARRRCSAAKARPAAPMRCATWLGLKVRARVRVGIRVRLRLRLRLRLRPRLRPRLRLRLRLRGLSKAVPRRRARAASVPG